MCVTERDRASKNACASVCGPYCAVRLAAVVRALGPV